MSDTFSCWRRLTLLRTVQWIPRTENLIIKEDTTQPSLDLPEKKNIFLFILSCLSFWECFSKIISQSVAYTTQSDPPSPWYRRLLIKSGSRPAAPCRRCTRDVPFRPRKSGAALLREQHILKRIPCGNELETFPLPNDPDRDTITVDLQGTSQLDFHLDLCLRLSE